MKKKMIMMLGALAVTATLGLGIYHSDAAEEEPALTKEDVENLVTNQYPGTITELELETDFNKAIYEVEIEGKEAYYELTLDGHSGEILKLKEKANVEASKQSKYQNSNDEIAIKEKQEESDENAQTEDKEQPEYGGKQGFNKQVCPYAKDCPNINSYQRKGGARKFNQNCPNAKNCPRAVIDRNKASDIALNEFSGDMTTLELDEDDGRLIYEVEIKDGDQEAKMEIDAHTGNILVIEIDN